MHEKYKRFITGLIPALAGSVFVLILLTDQVTDGGEWLLPVFLLLPFASLFLAWLIGDLILKIQNIPMRIISAVIIAVGAVAVAYIFGTNCDLQLMLGKRCNRLEKPATVYLDPNAPLYFPSVQPSENEVMQDLLSSWKATQSAFSVKASESGTYNPPTKVQFISADTMLAYYDDGLVDHISVLQHKGSAFVELKNVGVMSTMTQSQWQTLVTTYGDVDYPAADYQANASNSFAKVSPNTFVRADNSVVIQGWIRGSLQQPILQEVMKDYRLGTGDAYSGRDFALDMTAVDSSWQINDFVKVTGILKGNKVEVTAIVKMAI